MPKKDTKKHAFYFWERRGIEKLLNKLAERELKNFNPKCLKFCG
jgi:hypothetical protein